MRFTVLAAILGAAVVATKHVPEKELAEIVDSDPDDDESESTAQEIKSVFNKKT